MDRVRFIPGIQWAADIMTGRQPIPFTRKPKKNGAEQGFQALLDKEMERLDHEQGRSAADR